MSSTTTADPLIEMAQDTAERASGIFHLLATGAELPPRARRQVRDCLDLARRAVLLAERIISEAGPNG